MEGASLTKLATWASANPQLRSLQPIKVNDFLQLLNLTLTDVLNKHHQVYSPPLLFFAGYEELSSGPLGQIVTKESATHAVVDWSRPGPFWTEVRGFQKNHVDLPKPKDKQDPVYVWVKHTLLTCANDAYRCRYDQITPACGRLPEGLPNPSLDITDSIRSSAAKH